MSSGTAIQAKDKFRHGHVFVLVAPGDSVLFRYSDKYDHATMLESLVGSDTATHTARGPTYCASTCVASTRRTGSDTRPSSRYPLRCSTSASVVR